MRHVADPNFWELFDKLPRDVRSLAEKNFQLLKTDFRHPSLHFKKVGPYWSARVGRDYRAVAVRDGDACIWFWIGSHDEYERLLA